MRRVVITGMGTVNPLANNVNETWDAVKKGKCGIGPITHFDTSELKVKLAGEVKNLDIEGILGAKDAKRMDVYTQYACVAAKEAFEDSGLDMEKENADRIGCIVSSGIGGLSTIAAEHCKGEEKGYFEPGGSTIIEIFEKDSVRIDEDILTQSKDHIETKVKFGEGVGTAC